MKAGFHIWSIDADSVVLHDFIDSTLKFTLEPLKADVLLALNEPRRLETAANIGKRLPKLSLSLLYLRNTLGARLFLEALDTKLKENPYWTDQDAMEKVVADESLVTITGLGLSKDDLYPSMNMGGGFESSSNGPLSTKGTLLQSDRSDSKERDVGSVVHLADENDKGSKSQKFGFALGNFFSLRRSSTSSSLSSTDNNERHPDKKASRRGFISYSKKENDPKDSPLLETSPATRLHLLDQQEFINGAMVLRDSGSSTGRSGSRRRILHVGQGVDQEKVLRSKGYWFIDTQGRCLVDTGSTSVSAGSAGRSGTSFGVQEEEADGSDLGQESSA
jgi:hypothetical protein